MPIEVKPISPEQHLAWIDTQASVSFLQTPAWGKVKTDWRHESVGWFRDGQLIGTALVLYRNIPKLPWCLAYLPEGPCLAEQDLAAGAARMLAPLVAHAKKRKAFAITAGFPIWSERWHSPTLKDAIAALQAQETGTGQLSALDPDERNPLSATIVAQLKADGWQAPEDTDAFTAGQPKYVFQVPLAGRDEADLLKGFNQLWRRNIKRADKFGVEVREGTEADLPAFHKLYQVTAQRDHFTPRPASYFERMWQALRGEDPGRLRLFLAEHEGDLVAATLMTRVGTHVWYSYGASSTDKRDVRGSNAIQWRMMREALAEGADVYDMRGIVDTIDPRSQLFGLLQFKVGTGGWAQSFIGERTKPLNRPLYAAYSMFMARRKRH